MYIPIIYFKASVQCAYLNSFSGNKPEISSMKFFTFPPSGVSPVIIFFTKKKCMHLKTNQDTLLKKKIKILC